jgi:hypothetical protein
MRTSQATSVSDDITDFEKAVMYDGNLLQAADTVLCQIDDDGISYGSKEFFALVKDTAKEYGVSRRDLTSKIKELLE